ncbi:MAG: ABC transporter ATP-binding protein/permease [Deltaproteobacteria bacterium]|nr:ABC transporter ATP-binding protein/permease [Deltaproteobacteria bacterium]
MKIPTPRHAPADLRSGAPSQGRRREKIEKARDPRHALRRLLPYLRPFQGMLVVAGLLVVVYTLLDLIGPYLMGVAIDRFIAVRRTTGLAAIAGWMLLVYFFNNGFQALSSWLMADISQRALQAMRRDLFGHLQSLPVGFFDRNPAGELMSRLTNDIDAINQAVSQNVTSLLASLLSMAGILIAMFVLNPWLALASLLVVPLMFGFTEFVARYTRRGFRDLQRDLGGLNAVMEEAISGQRVVKACRRGGAVMAAFRERNEAVYRAAVSANSYAFLLMPLTGVLGNFFVIVLAGLGGWLALKGLVTVGLIATFINYGQNFISPLRQLANLYNSIQAALAGAERVFEILDTPAETADAQDARSPEVLRGEVRFEGVMFGYRPETPVIKGMSLDARPGETLALVGPTGAGKTTLINLLSRFYEIDSGRICLDGRDIRAIPKADLRRCLGIVLQDTFLFSATVMENIRYGRLAATDEECIEAARTAGADPFIRQLPQGYGTPLSERAGNLSQGQRQLLAIARAILADPTILILDEATSSVDTRTEARIQKALLALMAGRTSFVIAHRLSTIRDAGQVLVIDDGQIVERGTHRELLERRGFYHRLYLSQFKGQAI